MGKTDELYDKVGRSQVTQLLIMNNIQAYDKNLKISFLIEFLNMGTEASRPIPSREKVHNKESGILPHSQQCRVPQESKVGHINLRRAVYIMLCVEQ